MSKLESFKLFLWNPTTRKCMGRTGDSWLKLIGFYIALYSCLAAIWAAYYAMFHLTISDKYPKWQLDESIIGTNPGVGMRPSSPHQRVESALISYSLEGGDFKHWVDDLNAYLEELNRDPSANDDSHANQAHQQQNSTSSSSSSTTTTTTTTIKKSCNSDKSAQELEETFCPFDNSSIPAACTGAQNYSFAEGKPCILIKLNRIYGWKPKAYANKPIDYPDEAPFTPGNIQITCEGQHDPDKEHLGEVDYYPATGIDTKYYPFLNQVGYQSPYVMVHFKNPKPNTLIYIECKAWAENVEHDRYNKKGLTTFELFIEKAAAAEANSAPASTR